MSRYQPDWTKAMRCAGLELDFQYVPGHGLPSEDAWLHPSDAYARERDDAAALVANIWGVRTVEGAARPGTFGMRWAMTAFHGYRLFTALDETLFQRVVPPSLFYNLIVTGRKPTS